MKELNSKEKINLIKSGAFSSADIDGEIITAKNGRRTARINLRQWIRDRLNGEGIKQTELAEYVGCTTTSLNDFLSGRISSIPLWKIEIILWLLTPGNCRKI